MQDNKDMENNENILSGNRVSVEEDEDPLEV